MNMKVVSLSAVLVTAFAVPAIAHHSFAMFDAQKTITLQGTVKELEWTNPHAWLRVMVEDQKVGRPVLWAFEMSSPGRLVTMGMKADSVRPGDKVSVTFHPMKDGSRGGQFMQAALPNGQNIVRANARDENEEN
jgi:translation initiation factor IF-1